jgi:hypothetical protein
MIPATRLDHLLLRMEIRTNAVQQATYLEGKTSTTFRETPRLLSGSQVTTLPHFEPCESDQHNHLLSFKTDFNVTVAFTLWNSTWSVISDITTIRLLKAPPISFFLLYITLTINGAHAIFVILVYIPPKSCYSFTCTLFRNILNLCCSLTTKNLVSHSYTIKNKPVKIFIGAIPLCFAII